MQLPSKTKIRKLQDTAIDIRINLIKMLAEAGTGHTAGSLGMTDIFTAFYFHVLKHRPTDPNWSGRDRLILSNGHICPVRYASMAQAEYFDTKELLTLRKFGTRLQGHPEKDKLPGVETTSGPLGCGLGQSAGIALGLKMDKKNNWVYSLTSDGEHEEGNTWESVMFAAKYKLDNLIQVIDRNRIQIGGDTEKVMPLESLSKKYQAFNWHVQEVDGHNFEQFIKAIAKAQVIKNKPKVIIAKTVPGKGIPEIENDYSWHGKTPTKQQAAQFIHHLSK
jgi:transketolase